MPGAGFVGLHPRRIGLREELHRAARRGGVITLHQIVRRDAAAGPESHLPDLTRQDELGLSEIRRKTFGHGGGAGQWRAIPIGILAVGTANALADADRLDAPATAQIRLYRRAAPEDPGPVDIGAAEQRLVDIAALAGAVGDQPDRHPVRDHRQV